MPRVRVFNNHPLMLDRTIYKDRSLYFPEIDEKIDRSIDKAIKASKGNVAALSTFLEVLTDAACYYLIDVVTLFLMGGCDQTSASKLMLLLYRLNCLYQGYDDSVHTTISMNEEEVFHGVSVLARVLIYERLRRDGVVNNLHLPPHLWTPDSAILFMPGDGESEETIKSFVTMLMEEMGIPAIDEDS